MPFPRHPYSLGFGCPSATPAPALMIAARKAWRHLNPGRADDSPAAFAGWDKKCQPLLDSGLQALCPWPLLFFSLTDLQHQEPRLLTRSPVSFHHTGCHSIAESAALAAAGPQSILIAPRLVLDGMTFAIAGCSPADNRPKEGNWQENRE